MNAFELPDLDRQRAQAGKLYLEFLRVPALSLALYVLPAGDVDAQQPHKEYEVYCVVNGRATVRVGDEDRAVQAGASNWRRPACPTGFIRSRRSCGFSSSSRRPRERRWVIAASTPEGRS